MRTPNIAPVAGEHDVPMIIDAAARVLVAQVAPSYHRYGIGGEGGNLIGGEGGSVAELQYRGTVDNPQLPPNQPKPPGTPRNS